MDPRSTVWTLGVLLVTLMLQWSALAQQYEGCSSQFHPFPSRLPRRHMPLNPGQYIVPWLNFTCSGSITAWEFAASVQDDSMPNKQVILQLWEPRPININPTSPSQYFLVTEVVLSTSIGGTFDQERPFSFDLPQPLPVNSGNVFGFSVLDSERGVRLAAVTTSGMADGVIYSRQSGGSSRERGSDSENDDDSEEGSSSSSDRDEHTLFDISSNVNTIAPYSPAMTISFITDAPTGLATPASSTLTDSSSLPSASQTPLVNSPPPANQPSVINSSPTTNQPSVTDILPTTNQPPVVDQAEDTPSRASPIIIGVVVTLAMLVAASIAVITIVVVCSVKRPRVRGMVEGGTTQTEKGLAGFPYVKFRQVTNDQRQHPLVSTLSKYEAVVEHREIPRSGVTNQLHWMESQNSITTQYASTYDYAQGENEYASVGYYYVPPAVAREGKLQEWCKTATLVDVASMDEQSVSRLYENTPFAPPPPFLHELYNQLSKGMCIEIPRNTVNIHTLLGDGQFGEVFKGIWETPYGPQEVAIKMLKESSSDVETVLFLQEAAVMAQFRHPHIVRLLGSVTVGEPSMLILEYLHGGDLKGHLQSCIPYNDIHAMQLLQFCREIADGMKYLSNKGFVHRDLAARNILLDKNLKCKIADFGLSKDLQDGVYYISRGGKIPVKWTAPEALFYKKYSTSSDVWSYGMLMYEIWSLGEKPFAHLDKAGVLDKFQNDVGYVQPPPPGCPREMFKLMVLCWTYDHHSRPSFSQICNQLADSDSVLLSIPPQCLQGVSHPEEAQQLGQPLHMAHDLYLDLQCHYK